MIEFRETQRMTQWWIWAILLGSLAVVLLEIWQTVGPNPTSLPDVFSKVDIWFPALTVLVVIGLFLFLSLRTEVNSEAIVVTYFPILKTKIPWDELEEAQIITYGFVGYGIRLSFQYGTVYNARGNVGLQIVKKNGRKILIGTQKPDELIAVVNKLR